jgi:hypothetical protein
METFESPFIMFKLLLRNFRSEKQVVPHLKLLVAGLLPRNPGLDPRPLLVVGKVALGQVFEYFSLISAITTMLLTH